MQNVPATVPSTAALIHRAGLPLIRRLPGGDPRRMHETAATTWRQHLLLNRDARTDSARAEFARRCAGGELVRVEPGAYLPSELWTTYGERERFIARCMIRAAKADSPVVFTHASAAATWGLPWFGRWPERIDILRTEPALGHHATGVRRHVPRGDGTSVTIDGLTVTTLARTVVDIAAQPGFLRAVVVGDAALNQARRGTLAAPSSDISPDQLRAELETGVSAPVRARDVIAFLDPLSDSPGESISRVSMWRAGVPEPVLQHPFGSWRVDFWWPEFEVIGEFDGAVKYLDEGTRGGRSAEQVVYEEKLREDELRRHCRGFARWGYSVAMAPALLAERLRAAGVTTRRRTRYAAV